LPELPEVEVVRRGLDRLLVGHRFVSVSVLHPRAARSTEALAPRLAGREICGTGRRGKFLWLVLDGAEALVIHLRMSGQMRITQTARPVSPHTRIVAELDGLTVQFVDQRTFGSWSLSELVDGLPVTLAHIAPDLLDASLDIRGVAKHLKRGRGELKPALLNQGIVSGIGNIYADEMLWRARLHPRQTRSHVSPHRLTELLLAGQDVMRDALAQGGTSFDELYVNVNGESGYFDRSLNAYGKAGLPCDRCGTEMVKEKIGGRGSTYCPHCQRRY